MPATDAKREALRRVETTGAIARALSVSQARLLVVFGDDWEDWWRPVDRAKDRWPRSSPRHQTVVVLHKRGLVEIDLQSNRWGGVNRVYRRTSLGRSIAALITTARMIDAERPA